MSQRKWIKFKLAGRAESNLLTEVWNIETIEDQRWLGQVRWFGRWRRYALFPATGSVFEQDCLRDIANFCEEQTTARRALRASRKR